jgi:hypothetical protein
MLSLGARDSMHRKDRAVEPCEAARDRAVAEPRDMRDGNGIATFL